MKLLLAKIWLGILTLGLIVAMIYDPLTRLIVGGSFVCVASLCSIAILLNSWED